MQLKIMFGLAVAAARAGLAPALLAGAAAAGGDACLDKSPVNWLRHYATACDSLRTAALECRLCHVTDEELNRYGLDLQQVGNLPWLIEDWDSDLDGRSNGEEIGACTLPGVYDAPLPAAATTWGGIRACRR